MKKLLAIVMSICLALSASACSSSVAIPAGSHDPASIVKSLSPEDLTSLLKASKLPIDNIIVYTEESDKNHLLGKPNQYILKISFADTRLEQGDDPDYPKGGTIEGFVSDSDLTARKEYIEKVTADSPMLQDYMLVNGKYLLRLSRELTNDQVKEYENTFMAIK